MIALTIFATFIDAFRNSLWTSYRDYNSPYTTDLPSGLPRAAPAARVLVVLVRGLQLETSRQMTSLNGLRANGGAFVVQSEPPTYRVPAWTTLITGATAQNHGLTTNQPGRVSSANSLFKEIQLAGGSAVVVGAQSLGDTVGNEVQRFEVVDNADIAHHDDDAVRMGLDALKDAMSAHPAQLILIELTAIEDTLNENPSNSDAAATLTDTRLKTISDSIDLKSTAIVVLSDRGLPRQNADGGAEPDVALTPLVMAGAGVAPHSQGLIGAIDVAPTIAALIGLPIPAHAQGIPVLAGLSLSAAATDGQTLTRTVAVSSTQVITSTLAPLPALLMGSAMQLTTFYESWSETVHRPRFASELLRARQAAISSGDTDAYQKFVEAVRARADDAYNARLNTERSQRLPILVGAALFLVVIAGITYSSRHWQPFAGAILYTLGWYALYTYARGQSYSLSVYANGDPTIFLTSLSRDSAVLMLSICVLVALTTGHHDDGLDAVITVLNTVLLIACIQIGQAVWFFFQWGSQFTWALPDSQALVAAMVALTQVSALSLRIVPELPNLPIPLVVAFLSLVIFTLVRQREQPERYGRLR